MYIDKLDNAVDKYNDVFSSISSLLMWSCAHILENNHKDSKFKAGEHVRISKYKNVFAKGYTPNWQDQAFIIKIVKGTVPWTYAIEDLNGENCFGMF